MSDRFFDERGDQSEVKARIVTKYFTAWARVKMPTVKQRNDKINYIDLFAGPGRYKDGSASTPLMILERAISDPDLRRYLVTTFNDENKDYASNLQSEINKLPNVGSLSHAPNVFSGTIGESVADNMARAKLSPTFSFIDPFGYKGLSLKLINGAIKDWGCDCVFFFNYARINAGISNKFVESHIDALFGDVIASELRSRLVGLGPASREQQILEALAQSLKTMGAKFVLPFRFRNIHNTRSTHHLVFVTKHEKGYEIMKEILYKESSSYDQGVASLEYSPASASTPLLFSLSQPIDRLRNQLIGIYRGKSVSVLEVYKSHHIDTPFIKKNYKECLLALENEGVISVSPASRRKGTMPDGAIVTFSS